MSVDFTAIIRQWLRRPQEDQDPAQGAMLLLRLDRNQVFYRAALANPQRYLPEIRLRLQSHLHRRQQIPTPQQVRELSKEADSIISPSSDIKKIKGGRRPDHDSLPPEIRKLYEDNLELRHKMQQYHLQIRTLLQSKADCAPSDIKDLVSLLRDTDAKYLKNWKKYDEYTPG